MLRNTRKHWRAYAYHSMAGLSLVLALSVQASTVQPGHEEHWGYRVADGPAKWGSIKPAFKLCAEGKSQSPINIQGSIGKGAPKVQLNYNDSSAAIENNGHTIQVNMNNGGYVEMEQKKYYLVQFHFHAPSEEQINGKSADMVAQLVHKTKEGEMLVIAVLLNRGAKNELLAPVFDNLPKAKGKIWKLDHTKLNLTKLIPKPLSYYYFPGSLTTPPCTEGVRWFVMKRPQQISSQQYQLYTQLYKNNVRNIQPIMQRKIVEN